MAENNDGMVNLGDLGSASSGDIRKALEGQPSPVQSESAPETPETEPVKEKDANDAANDFGTMLNNQLKHEDGTFSFVNPYSSYLDQDLDQFETKRRRVSEDSMLSGILNGVEGLEEGFVYSGMDDTMKRSEEAQGVVNKMKNGMTQLVADTAINVGQGFASLLYGVPSAIVNGDLTKLYDNSVANAMDKGTEFLDEFYKIKRGGDQSGMQKTANFLFDDLAGGASFVMGAIATEMAFSALTAVTFGGAAPAQAAATVGLVARGTRLAQKALQGGKALMAGNLVDDALRGARALGQTATRANAASALRAAGQAAKTPMAMQAAARVSRQLITGASMESGMEARHMLNAAVENQKEQHEKMYGEGTFTEEMGDAFRENISGYADGVFGANMALVGASNMLMFPKLFGVGLRRGMQTSKFIDTTKLSSKARARLAKNLGMAEGKLPRMVDAARGNTMGRIVGRTGQGGRITARNMKNALYEGFVEEGGQGAISRSTEDYISKKYDPAAVNQTVKYVDSFLEGLKGSYTTKDGFKEIGIGMLLAFTGVPMYAKGQKTDADGKVIEGSEWKWRMMGGYADARQSMLAEDKKMDAIIKLNEKYGDVGGIMKAEVENFHRQNALQKEQDVAVAEGRFKEAKDKESEMIFSHAASKIVTGRYEQSIAEAEQIMEEMSADEFREQYGEPGKNMTDAEVQERKAKVLAKHKQRMENARQAYEKAQDVYRGEDSDITTGVAHMLYMTKEKDAREKDIAEKIAGAIEGMNEGQILDLVRMEAELNMTNEDANKFLARINQLKDINKQLETKRQRKIIKNIDPEKAASREKEIADLQEASDVLLQEIQAGFDAMATAQNVDRGKYNFDMSMFDDLSLLHMAISRQRGTEYQAEDIGALFEDMRAVAQDRFELIENYNDFIRPGGVARFEARMIGSIERLADKSPEQQMAQKQREANQEDTDALRNEVEGTEVQEPVQEKQERKGDPTNMPPGDDGSGSFSGPSQADTAAPDGNFGFPEPEGYSDPTVPDAVPGNVGLGNEAKNNDQPKVPPAAQQPAGPAVGRVNLLMMTNARHADERNDSVVREDYKPVVARLYPGIPVGTSIFLRSDETGTYYEFEDGQKIAPANDLTPGVQAALKQANGQRIELITTSEVTRQFTGGEKVTKDRAGKKHNPYLQRRVGFVLPNGMQDVVGIEIGTRTGTTVVVGEEALPLSPTVDERFVGDTYIGTVDATGNPAWHPVKTEAMGEKRAEQIMDLLDAYNQMVVNKDELSPKQYELLSSFFMAANINPNQDPQALQDKTLQALRQTVRSAFASDQKAKAAEDTTGEKVFFGFEATAKGAMTIGIMKLKHDANAPKKYVGQFSHSRNGDTRGSARQDFIATLSNQGLNIAREGISFVPDGNGVFETVDTRELIQRHGLFSDRMPIVTNGEIYNQLVTGFDYVVKDQLAPVPTDRDLDTRQPQTTSDPDAKAAEMGLSLDGLSIDLGSLDLPTDLGISPLMDENSTDPMERAGAQYDIKGLNSRQLRDGMNAGAGIMAGAMIQHMRTKKRNRPVKADYLRRRVRDVLELQLAKLRTVENPNPSVKAMIEAHELYLSDAVFDRLVDLSMVEMLRQAKGVIQPSSKSNLADALSKLTENEQTATELDEQDAAERSENPMAAFDDNFAFGVDPKSTLRLEAKMMLMALYDTSTDNYHSVGLAGRRFMSAQDLMAKLNAELAGVEPSFEAVDKRLEEATKKYPQLQAVRLALRNSSAYQNIPPALRDNKEVVSNTLALQDMIRNQFVVFASKEATTFDSVKYVSQVENIDPTAAVAADIQVWNSNSRNMRRHVQDDIRSVLVQHGFFNLDGSINQDRFKEVHGALVELTKSPQADQARELSEYLAKEFGINVPAEAFTDQNPTKDSKGRPAMYGIAKALDKPRNTAGVYGRFRSALQKVGAGKMDIEQMLSDKGKMGSPIVEFFTVLADYQASFIQNSSKDGDNKTRHHFSAPNLLHQMARDVKDRALNPRDGQPLPLLSARLQTLGTDPRGLFGLTYYSGIKLDNRGNERDYHAMEEGDRVLAQLALYGNRNEYTASSTRAEKRMVSKFMLPTLADKHRMPIMQAPALSAQELGIVLDPKVAQKQWKDLRVRDYMPNIEQVYQATEVYAAIDLEIDRILRIQAQQFEGMTAAQRKAVAFVTMPGLNGLAQDLIENGNRNDFRAKVHAQAVQIFETAMNEDLQYMLAQTQGTVWKEGTRKNAGKIAPKMMNMNPSKKQFEFMRNHVAPNAELNQGGMNVVAYGAFLAKFAVDSASARTGLVVDAMGDPGAFAKLKNGVYSSSKTATNLGKRFASLIAPGNAIPYVTYRDRNGKKVHNKSVNILVMPARTVSKAAHYDYLKNKLKQSPDQLAMQEGYDSADAAEYTTVEEHLGILYAKGEITRREMAGILGKIKNGKPLDNAELAWFQPMKPVTSGRVGDHMLYIKSASFPLVPQLTQGTELDKLRVFMEKNKIHRAAYDSAVKLGNEWSEVNDESEVKEMRMVPVHNGDAVEITDELKSRVLKGVDRKFMRIQQEVPVSKAKEKVHGSQAAKLFLVDLTGETFTLDGKTLDGGALYDEYMVARKAEMDARKRLFAQKYGMNDNLGMLSHTSESKKRLAERMAEEGVERGYDPNEMAHIFFNEETQRFETPLAGGPSQDRVENLLKAIVFKEIYEPAISGFSGPIRPEVGIKTLDDKLVDESDIMWVKKGGKKLFDGKKLKVAEGKQMDQIIMPWKYKASLEKYMDGSNINADNLPPELLQTFAYRIPGQQKSSSTAFEIVGFLPEQYGDTLIVNEELVGRIGQDYDIDKMFGFLYAIKQDDNGDITVTRSGETIQDEIDVARNRQVDIYIAAMQGQGLRTQQAIHSPITDGYAESLADILEGLRSPEAVSGMPMSVAYNGKKADAARSGKASIGVFAVHDVLHAQFNQATKGRGIPILTPVKITPTPMTNEEILKWEDNIKWRIGGSEIHDTTFILEGYKRKPEAGLRSEQFSRLANHAVDNANNGLLDKLGINQDTWAIWTGLTHMGYNQETIGLLVAMPSVQRYLSLARNSRRLGEKGGRIDVSTVMSEVEKAYADNAKIKIEDARKQLMLGKTLDKQTMADIVRDRAELSETDRLKMDYAALSAVATLITFSKEMQRVQAAMKLDTNRPKSVIGIQVVKAQIAGAYKGDEVTMERVQALTVAQDRTVSGVVTRQVQDTFQGLFNVDGNVLSQGTVNDLVKDFQDAEVPGKLEDNIETLVKGAKSLAYTKFTKHLMGKSSAQIRQEAHDIRTGGIATRLMEMRKNKAEIRNNPFVRQLIAVKGPGTYPHLEFTGDRQLEMNPNEMHLGFLNLLRSSDPEVAAFGKELVGYALATSGGRLKSRGYLKYVPAQYLQKNGLADFVGMSAIQQNITDFSTLGQILRHNPDVVPTLSAQAGYPFMREGDQLLLPKSSRNFRGAVRYKGKLYLPTGHAMTVKDEVGLEVMVYPVKQATELGDHLTDEYSTEVVPFNQKPTQKLAKQSNQLAPPPDVAPNVVDEAPPQTDRDVPNTTEGFTGAVPTGAPSGMTLGTEFTAPTNMPTGRRALLRQAVGTKQDRADVSNDFTNFLNRGPLKNQPFLRMLADAQENLPEGKRLKVKVVGRDAMKNRGQYDPTTHTMFIREDHVGDNRVVTHEAVHAVTQLAIEVAEGKLEIKDPKMKAELVRQVGEIKKLFAQATSEENLMKMGLSWKDAQRAKRGFRAYTQKTPEQRTAQDNADIEFLRENLDAYYGVVSLKEFVAEAFSNPEFADRLSKLSLNRNKSFFGRLFGAIKAAMRAMGINVTKDSEYLQEVYFQTMGLVDMQTRQGITAPQGVELPTSYLLDQVSQEDTGRGIRGQARLVEYKEKRIRQFEELKSRYAENREFVRRVEARLIQERKDLARLTDDSVEVTPDYLLGIGQRELDFARRTIEAVDPTDPEIDMALSALENVYSVVEFYDAARHVYPDADMKQVATDLRREAAELKDNYLEKARIILRQDAIREFKGKGVDINAETFEVLQQTGYMLSRFQDASRQGVKELSYLDKIVRDAGQKQRAQFNERARRYMDLSKTMQQGEYFKKHGWNGFVELDADDNPTPYMITMLSGRFEQESRAKYAELGSSKEYYDWRNSVTGRIDINAMFDIDGDTVVRKKNPKYVAFLEKKYGAAGAQEFLNQQEIKLQNFVDARVSEFDTLELTLGRENAEQAKADWLKKNDPRNAYKRAEGKMKGVKGQNSDYLLFIPLPSIKGKSTDYYDSRFQEMMADPAAMEFYNDYRKQMAEMMTMLPDHKMRRERHLMESGLFIPAISKSMTRDLLSVKGMMDAVKNLPDDVKAALTIDPELDINQLIDPLTGRPRQELPTYFLGQVDPETQEYNMDRTFLAFAMMATTYDSKNKVEDKVRMTRSVLSNASVRAESTLSERLLQKIGALDTNSAPGYRDAASREAAMKSVDTLVDTFYGYQQTNNDLTAKADRNMWTKEQTARIEKLEAEMEAATTQEEKDAKQKEIDAATPLVSTNKAIRRVQQFTQAKGMAWNIPAAIVNMIFGGLSVFKHAAGRADFNENHARKATGIMMHASLNNMTEAVGKKATGTALKLQNMMVNFDVLKDFTEMRYDVRKFVDQANQSGVNQAARQGFNKLRMYEIQRSSEYFVYGQAVVSQLLAIEVDGKSLWEHMDENGVIQLEGYKPGQPKHLELVSKLDQINKRIHGNYDPASPIAIKKTMLGPLLMQFRSWLPEAVATRFEKEKYDAHLDRNVKGYYRTMFFDGAIKRNLKAMMPLLLPSFVRTKNMDTLSAEISELDQENIRKFAAEMRQYMNVMIFIAMLRALKDDEEDEKNVRLYNFGLNLSSRVENDLSTFFNPKAFLDMTQGDFLAVIGLATDVQKFGESVVETVAGDGEITTGVHAGKQKMIHHGGKLIPHVGWLQRLSNQFLQEIK